MERLNPTESDPFPASLATMPNTRFPARDVEDKSPKLSRENEVLEEEFELIKLPKLALPLTEAVSKLQQARPEPVRLIAYGTLTVKPPGPSKEKSTVRFPEVFTVLPDPIALALPEKLSDDASPFASDSPAVALICAVLVQLFLVAEWLSLPVAEVLDELIEVL